MLEDNEPDCRACLSVMMYNDHKYLLPWSERVIKGALVISCSLQALFSLQDDEPKLMAI